MDIALGVSLTSTTVRMVLVEGEKADGVTLDHDVIAILADEDMANPLSPADQVIAAIEATRDAAIDGGHRLAGVGVTWRDDNAAADLSAALRRNGIDDVMLVSELHAAGALAVAAGAAMDYRRTALMFLERDTVTVSVVDNADGSIIKVQRAQLHTADAVADLCDMLVGLQDLDVSPDGVFVVGSGVNVAAIKLKLESATALAINAPGEPELALARGAALAGTQAPAFEASTAGLAYAPAGAVLSDAATRVGAADVQELAYSEVADDVDDEAFDAALRAAAEDLGELDEDIDAVDDPAPGRRPFLLVGSALTAVFVIGISALAVSLVATISPAAKQEAAAPQAVVPVRVAPAAPPAAAAQPAAQEPPAAQEQVATPPQAPRTVAAQAQTPVVQAPTHAAAPVAVPTHEAAVPTQEVAPTQVAPVVAPVVVPVPEAVATPAPEAVPTQAPAVAAPSSSVPAPGFYPGTSDSGRQQQYPYQRYPVQQYPSQRSYPSWDPAQQSPSQYSPDNGRSRSSESKRGHGSVIPLIPLPWPFNGR